MHPQTDETPKAEGRIVPSDVPEAIPVGLARRDSGSIQESESGSETTAVATDSEGPSAVCSSPVTPTASVTPTSSVMVLPSEVTPTSSVTVLPSKVTPTSSKDGGPPLYPLKSRLSRIKSITSNREKEWSIHWYLPFLMAALYLAGVCCAVGHHFYYTLRNGKTADSLEWPVRFGTALAFIVVNCFIGAAQIAYKQCAWRILKRKSLRLETIDRVFGASRDPTEACSTEFIRKAPSQILIAAVCWLMPIAAIAAPTALVVVPSTMTSSDTCNVPSLNFSRENGFDEVLTGQEQGSICYWNITYRSPTWFYDMPSYDFEVMATLSWATNSGPLPAANSCPIGHNCTYTISFDGPAYKCDDMADFDGTTEQTLDEFAPSNTTVYSGSQIIAPGKLDAYGIPADWFNVTDVKKYGFFTKDYPIWMGYLVNTTKPSDGPNKSLWPYELDRKVIKCTMNHAKYDVTMGFVNGQQVITDTQVQYNGPILLEGQSVAPTDPTYKQFSSYHAIGFRFQDLLSNNNYQDNASTYAYPVSEIAETTLVDHKTLFAVDDFPRAVERKFSDLILSILSRPQLVPYVNISTPCTIESAVQVWDYRPFWLAMSYAIASGVTLLVIAVGTYALLDNGYGMDTSFSTMLAVSRNGELDSLMEGCSLGRTPLPERVLKTRLQFGEAVREAPAQMTSPIKHAAFGFEANVRSIEVGGEYH